MKYRFLSLIVFMISIMSCTKDESDIRLPEFDVPVITGFYLRDQTGMGTGVIGDPNVRTCGTAAGSNSDGTDNTGSITGSTICFTAFPNPFSGLLMLYFETPLPETEKLIWITRAVFGNQASASANSFNMALINVGGAPLFQLKTTGDEICLDLSSFDRGYYRIYIKIGDSLLYDNLVIQK
jgi:hypothetical protein